MSGEMPTSFQPGGGAVPVSVVELSISCRNLIDADIFSKSDPMVVMYIKEFGMSQWREFGRTETIQDNLNPDFVKKFVVNYYFEERQQMRFDVYDIDSNSRNLADHDFLGTAECSIGEVISADNGVLTRKINGPKTNSGSIIAVSGEELTTCKQLVHLKFQGRKLDKKDFFGKSDPFLVFWRSKEDSNWVVVHKTEVIKNTLNPNWRQFEVKVQALCNGDHDRVIKVECYDWNSSGSHSLIGEFFTTLKELLAGPQLSNSYKLIHPEKRSRKKGYDNSGVVSLMHCQLEEQHSFIDYIRGGTQLNCTIAIDFTASNGNPSQASSLHYLNPMDLNHYARALSAVGTIIQDYDSDKLFPALGFGARIPPNGVVSHEFFLNGDAHNPFCQGIDGVMAAYYHSLNTVQLYGPTNFAPVINHVARFAAAKQDGSEYFILLILTDGVITDMPQTKEAIVNASTLPLSIIIVGIGTAEFDSMVELDGDDVRVSSRGRQAVRDIVQFVPFRDFMHGSSRADMETSQARLAKEVLAEIPDQFMSFMRSHHVKPNPPPPTYAALTPSGTGGQATAPVQ